MKKRARDLQPSRAAIDYFLKHHVDFGVRVADGFYDPGRLLDEPCLPSAAELGQRPSSKGAREVLLADAQSDEPLRSRIERAREQVRMITDPLDRIKVLAGFASDELGGASRSIRKDTDTHIAELMKEARSPIVPLGALEYGVCRHRALLFKVLCDAVGIACRLVRGNYGGEGTVDGGAHAWNVVRLNGGLRVVDVMHRPGEVWSEKAAVNRYHRLVERGAAPGGGLGAGLASISPAPRDEWYLPPGLIEIARRADGKDDMLGEGGFGAVFRGTVHGVQRVAVKRLLRAAGPAAAAEFRAEVAMLHRLSHPHIVVLFGACDDVDNLMLVTELMGGDLYQAIRAAPEQLAWNARGMQVAQQIALALHYLHSLEPAVCHRDIKSLNVLLAYDYALAKLADLGLARTKSCSLMPPQQAYTQAYAAPEVLLSKRASEKVDLYSFGVMLWELLTQKTPERGALFLPPSVQPAALRRIVQRCLEPNAHLRPSAAELAVGLFALEQDGRGAGAGVQLAEEAAARAVAKVAAAAKRQAEEAAARAAAQAAAERAKAEAAAEQEDARCLGVLAAHVGTPASELALLGAAH